MCRCLTGVPIRIEDEIDYSFAPDLSTAPPPVNLRDVDMNDFWAVWQLIEKEFVPKPEKRTQTEGSVIVDGNEISEESVVSERLVGEGPSRRELVNGAIDGLTFATGDQYTNFFDPQNAKEFEEEVLRGEIDGIGAYITFEEEDLLTISSVIKNGPAFYSGLQANDVITKIDGVLTNTYNLSEAARAIRGLRGECRHSYYLQSI